MANFTQKAIIATFQDMLEEMPFDKITVSAIVKRCQISSNTFYYHYQNIYDLLDIWLQEEFGRFTKETQAARNWAESVKDLLHSCQDNARLVYHVVNSLSRERLEQYVFSSTDDIFIRYVQDQTAGQTISREKLKDISTFCRYAFIGYFLNFLWNHMEDDVDASVDKLSELFAGFVRQAVTAEGEGEPSA